MATIREVVEALSRRTGVDAVVVVGRDGLPIDSRTANGVDAESVAALLPSVINGMAQLGQAGGRGDFGAGMLEFGAGVALVSGLHADALPVVLVQPSTNVGALLYDLRRPAPSPRHRTDRRRRRACARGGGGAGCRAPHQAVQPQQAHGPHRGHAGRRAPPRARGPPVSVWAAILAGGSGTRFWPLSTAEPPKQLLPLAGARPLLQQAVERLDGLVPPERILILTGPFLVDQVAHAVPQIP